MSRAELAYDHFAKYFPHAPLALCIKECARLGEILKCEVEGPILDVGCGDGLFARIAFDAEEVWGIDIDGQEGRWAQASRAYTQIVLADITRAKLPSAFFRTCIANCSLEHVPDIKAALTVIHDSLVPGGKALLFVPNRDWASKFMTVRAVRAALGAGAAKFLQDGIDEFFKHHHLYDEAGWRETVEKSPLRVVDIRPVLSTSTTMAFETFLIPSLAGWLNKKLTTRWTNFPGVRRAYAPLAYALAKAALDVSGSPEKTAEFLVVAERGA